MSVFGGGLPGGPFELRIFPDFTDATGIEVESVARPDGERWIDLLARSAAEGEAPADVSMLSRRLVNEGAEAGLWAPIDRAKVPNSDAIGAQYFDRYPSGDVAGIATVTRHGYDVSGSWVVLRSSQAVDEAHAFINFMCRPEIQMSLATGRGWSLQYGRPPVYVRRA